MKLLQEDRRANADAPLTWNDLARGASRAKEARPEAALQPDRARGAERALPHRARHRNAGRSRGRDRQGPGRQALLPPLCLLMADLAGDPPKKPKPKPKPKPKKTLAPAPAPAS